MLSDLRLALRSLAKAPTFTAIAVLTLALGLGVNIAVFGIIQEFMLRPLAVRDASQLVFVMQRNPELSNMPFPVSYPDYVDLRRRVESKDAADAAVRAVLSGMLAYTPQSAHISEPGKAAERGWVHEVSDNYFTVLGIQPALGRLFSANEATTPNADAIAILSDAYWREKYGADPGVLGRKILLNGAPFTIVGVTPPKFVGAEAMVQAQIFVPATMAQTLRPQQGNVLTNRGYTLYMVVARLQPTARVAQAWPLVNGMMQQIAAAFPDEHRRASAAIVPEALSRPSPYVSQFTAPALGVLMMLAALVLAVAAANIANLMFARAADAERALAIRSALGATRGRLIGQLLAESVVIAAGAGIVGWYASHLFGYLLQTISISGDNPPMAAPSSPWASALFAALAALITGVLTGLAPACRASRVDVIGTIKQSGPTSSRARHPLRTVLVGAQVTLACIVLACAGLALRSSWGLAHVELGFNPRNALIATFDLEMQRYSRAQAANFQRELLRAVRALPGVTSAGLARSVPFDKNYGLRDGIGAEGYVPRDAKDDYLVNYVAVSDGFVEAMQAPLLAGRSFLDRDDESAPRVTIVSKSVAEHFWPGKDAVGRRLTINRGATPLEVVGIVPDMRYLMMAEPGKPLVFVPLKQDFSGRVTLVARSDKDPLGLAASVTAISTRLDPALPVYNLTTFDRHIRGSPMGLMVLRLGTAIALTQAGLVVVLSVMGIYGLVAFSVARRTREIGIRLALGAPSHQVVEIVARPSALLTAAGLLVGLSIAALITRQFAMLFFGGARFDWTLVGAVAGLLIAVTLFACWLPARRALAVNPVDTLKAE